MKQTHVYDLRRHAHIFVCVRMRGYLSTLLVADYLCPYVFFVYIVSFVSVHSFHSCFFFFLRSPSRKPVYLGICSIFFRKEWFTRLSGSPSVTHYSDFKELGNKQK